MEPYIKDAAHMVALLSEAVAILLILIGIIKAIVFYFSSPLPYEFRAETVSALRSRFGSSLSLSLEFLIGADILRTAISPSWNDIGMLGAIVVIRTVLNYFLTEELRSVP